MFVFTLESNEKHLCLDAFPLNLAILDLTHSNSFMIFLIHSGQPGARAQTSEESPYTTELDAR
jgi:hypothetical protein